MHQLTCAHCTTPFGHDKATALYCSTLCKHRAKHDRQVVSGVYANKLARRHLADPSRAYRYPESATCSAADCERRPTHRAMCKMHYRRQARARGLEQSPSSAWSEARKRTNQKRKAITRGATAAERIDKLAVYERDRWTCGICTQPVDPTLTYPHPYSASLDHRVALANGGTHTYANTQCGHLVCNQRKGAREVPALA